MNIKVLGRKAAGILMAAMIAVSAAAVTASAEELGGAGDAVTEPNTIAREVDAQAWELIDPDSITDANATAGGGMKLVVTFTEAFAEGYEIQINFTTESGVKKTFTASTQKPPMLTNFSCIPIRDIYDKLGLGGEKLASVTFTGKSAGQITRIEYASGSYYAPASSGAAVTSSAPGADKNPSTGVADIAVPAVIALGCGAAAVLTSKSRRNK